jgi:Domain of unknown function (DUF4149)
LTVLNQIRTLLLAAWLGAAIYFSAVIAPAVFGVLRSFLLPNANEIAGTIVTRSLTVINMTGFAASLLLLAGGLVLRRRYGRTSFLLQIVFLAIVAVATGVGEWVIAAKMRSLRIAMLGQIDQLALTDPNRVAFATLHGYSVSALGIAIIAGLVTFFVIAPGFRSD